MKSTMHNNHRWLATLLALMMALSLQAFAGTTLRGDVNNNDEVTIADVTALIDYLLSGAWNTLGRACRVSLRADIIPSSPVNHLGLRLAL